MSGELKLSVGQHSDRGRKPANQDFHGVFFPKEPQLRSKGIAIALADGISSSDVSHIASESAVTGFLDDYYCTSDAWSVRTAAERVLTATNSWLHSQTQQSQGRYDKDRGYVCTFSALIVKSSTAHIFHIGDTRIYRVHDKALEQLTSDHRLWVSPEKSYLSRALGIDSRIEIDYQAFQVEPGDQFVLATDGVYEFATQEFILAALREAGEEGLADAARRIVEHALEQGSADNLTVQLVRIDTLPDQQANEMVQQLGQLALPPLLEARMDFDGYRIIREVHASHRSHVYLATDAGSEQPLIIKTPSIDLHADPAYIERFLMEEWVARRIDSVHVLKACPPTRKRNFLYVVTEFIDGQSLTQWMVDHPKPQMEAVRDIVEQIAKGLRAFHRLDMLHQDLRPENIMIDSQGTVKIIDFGSTLVAGVTETWSAEQTTDILGTAQYTAPEYFLGEAGSSRSDLFSLGVITYQMLTAKLPYGAEVAKTRSKLAQRKLRYDSVLDERRELPPWIDHVLHKAVHPDPEKRYQELSEFVFDLRHPNQAFLNKTRAPLIERDPLLFWKCVCCVQLVVILLMLAF